MPGGVWHLLVRAEMPAIVVPLIADEAMPDPDRQPGIGVWHCLILSDCLQRAKEVGAGIPSIA